MSSTNCRVRLHRSRASGESATRRPSRATATTSAIVSDCPSIRRGEDMGGMSVPGRGNSRSVGLLLLRHAPAPEAPPIVVELELRLRLERDEEVESEVSVRRLGEREDRVPVVQLALQRDDVTREL